MLTEEQIKNIKPGDPVIIHGTFKETYHDGNIKIYRRIKDGGTMKDILTYVHTSCVSLPSEHGTSIPTPKYDPCRLFKKGDKVKLTKWNGRICEKFFRAGIYCGANLTVVRDEDCFLNVTVRTRHGIEKAILSPFLELVTPVEDLEPYSVQETMSHDGWQIVRDGLPLAIYDSRRHPNAKAAAEAERDRLNAEYRKKQET